MDMKHIKILVLIFILTFCISVAYAEEECSYFYDEFDNETFSNANWDITPPALIEGGYLTDNGSELEMYHDIEAGLSYNKIEYTMNYYLNNNSASKPEIYFYDNDTDYVSISFYNANSSFIVQSPCGGTEYTGFVFTYNTNDTLNLTFDLTLQELNLNYNGNEHSYSFASCIDRIDQIGLAVIGSNNTHIDNIELLLYEQNNFTDYNLCTYYTSQTPATPACTEDWSCTGYENCLAPASTADCNSVLDLNTCGTEYTGNYSEFTPNSCRYGSGVTYPEKNLGTTGVEDNPLFSVSPTGAKYPDWLQKIIDFFKNGWSAWQ